MKLIKEHEVEGCWSSKEAKSRCRACGSVLELTPAEGHYNSKFWGKAKLGRVRTFESNDIKPSDYWKTETADGCYLYNCPKGCSEVSAVAKMRKYMYLREYLTKECESYNFELDFDKIDCFWMSPLGEIVPCDFQGHINCAEDYFESAEPILESKGFAKLTSGSKLFIESGKLTQKQIDSLFDFCVVKGWGTDWVNKEYGTMICLNEEGGE